MSFIIWFDLFFLLEAAHVITQTRFGHDSYLANTTLLREAYSLDY